VELSISIDTTLVKSIDSRPCWKEGRTTNSGVVRSTPTHHVNYVDVWSWFDFCFISPLPLTQVGQLSVTGTGMCTRYWKRFTCSVSALTGGCINISVFKQLKFKKETWLVFRTITKKIYCVFLFYLIISKYPLFIYVCMPWTLNLHYLSLNILSYLYFATITSYYHNLVSTF